MHIYRKIMLVALLTSSLVWWNMGAAPQEVFAFGNFLSEWSNVYPNSTSNGVSCQLCHQNGSGGNGWNPYGWNLRQQIKDEGLSIIEAIQAIEEMDSDGNGQTNLEEITGNAQPGWTTGAVNTIYFRDGTTATEQSPPENIELLDVGDEGEENTNLTNPIPVTITTGSISVTLTTVITGLLSPVGGTSTASMPDYLFVTDQQGIVSQTNLTNGEKSTFLDISSSLVELGISIDILTSTIYYDERGLLGFAFHPDYADNGLVYTHSSEPISGTADFSTMSEGQVADHQSVIAQWQVDDPSDPASVVNPDSKKVLMRVDQPQFNHNGGVLAFGPDDMLYIGFGDGGGADDQDFGGGTIGHGENGNGQDTTNPLGAILRIDPAGNDSNNGQYGIPLDNPFVDDEASLGEIFAYGLRNPFNFSFDSESGTLYAGDVGQNQIEEINVIESGGNYGWPLKEGTFFFDANGTGSGVITDEDPGNLPADLIDPIAQYDHDEGISVIGGFVYRGSAIPALQGRYVFGDWGRTFGVPPGRLFYLTEDNSIAEFELAGENQIEIFVNSMAQDGAGELYLLGNTSADLRGDNTGVALRIGSDISTGAGDTDTGDTDTGDTDTGDTDTGDTDTGDTDTGDTDTDTANQDNQVFLPMVRR